MAKVTAIAVRQLGASIQAMVAPVLAASISASAHGRGLGMPAWHNVRMRTGFRHRLGWRAIWAVTGLIAVSPLLGAGVAGIDSATLIDLPYRDFEAKVDGKLEEWQSPYYEFRFQELEEEPARRNSMRVVAVWDYDALLFGFAIADSDLILAPAKLEIGQYHQYDSAQFYIDAVGDISATMNDDDVDILLLPDGRHGVMRGDELISALAAIEVPQRVGTPLALEYAVQRHAGGWSAELRLPFAGLGLRPETGHKLGVDFAINDWRVFHAPIETSDYIPVGLRAQLQVIEAVPTAPLVATPADAAVADAAEIPLPFAPSSQYLPLNWNYQRDFGYPAHWRRLVLVGQPAMGERLLRRYGAQRVLLSAGLFAALLSVVSVVLLWYVHRRRLRRLTRLLADMHSRYLATHAQERAAALAAAARDVATIAAGTAPDPAATDAGAAIEANDEIGDGEATLHDPRDAVFTSKVLEYVRGHLTQALAPADLAERFHISLRTLQRRLRSGVGSGPKELVLAARLEAARELLASGEWRVSEVATRVGFDNLSHFSRRFRDAYGIAPSSVARRAVSA